MRSIRGILFRYISVVWVVGLSSVAGVTFFLSKKALEQFAQDDYEHLIHSVGHQVETSFQEQLLALDKIAELPGFQPFEPAKAAALAENFLQYDNIFSTIHAYYADGRLAFAKKRALFPPYNIEPNFNQKYDKEYIQLAKRVLQNNERAASTAFVTSLGEIYQTYLVPIRDPKRPHAQPIGLVSGAVFPKVKGLNKWIEGLKLGEDNFILVTDPKGQIVVESGKIDPALRPILSDHVAGFLKDAYPGGAYNGAAGSPPTVKARVRSGIPYLLVAEAVPSLNLLIVLGASTARIEERVSS
ncbi:MAG: cache domain-containing protein, partial [Bacteriovoracia bacterium]